MPPGQLLRALRPLAFPALAGPSALATVILLVSQAPERRLEWIAALCVTMVVCAVFLVLSERIQRFAGNRVMMAFERLIGLILVTVAVEILLRGIRMFLTQMPRQDVRNLIFESICRQRARSFLQLVHKLDGFGTPCSPRAGSSF